MSPFPNSHSADEPVIDFTRVAEVAEGDAAFERKVLETYVQDLTRRIEVLQNALAASDLKTAVLEAHNIKGASGNVGALSMRAAAEACEQAAREGATETSALALTRIRAEFARASSAIAARLA